MKVAYDLHLHSCLSPCGDNAMTPATIAGVAKVVGLDVVALTDHNSTKNCDAFLKACDYYGILGIPGMELTTKEEVHVVCLFKGLKDALNFDRFVYSKLLKIKNNPNIFGHQFICDPYDHLLDEEENLLINATSISFDEVYDLVAEYEGVMIPAHIDKGANSVLSNLGFIPENSQFRCVELRNLEHYASLSELHPYIKNCLVISNSDAHYIQHINDPIHYLDIEEKTREAVIKKLKNI